MPFYFAEFGALVACSSSLFTRHVASFKSGRCLELQGTVPEPVVHINEPSSTGAMLKTLFAGMPPFLPLYRALRAVLSNATSLAVQGATFPEAEDVHLTFLSGPGRTWMVCLMLGCPAAVEAVTPKSIKVIANFLIPADGNTLIKSSMGIKYTPEMAGCGGFVMGIRRFPK